MKLESRIFTTLFSTLALSFASIASGVSNAPSISSSVVTWDAAPGYGLTLNVSGAGRYEFAPGEAPILMPYDVNGKALADGTYTWQLTATPVLSEKEIEARRQGKPGAGPMGTTESGSFSIVAGSFVDPTVAENESEKVHTIAEDLIVSGSACVGIDCTNSQTFEETLLLRENNLAIHFEDTSDTNSFPTTDWRLAINESDNGGLNKFSIEDASAVTIPFTVEGGAPSNTIYGQADGDVGIGTNDPVVRLHMVSGREPALRLEQDGSQGFAAQAWDLRVDDQSFAIADVTSGNDETFVIENGAPDNTLYIADEGYVGIGTDNPTRPMHIKADGLAHVAFEHEASARRWNVGANSGAFIVSLNNSGNREFEIKENGDVYFRQGTQQLAKLDRNGNLSVTGLLTTGGTACGGGCDAVFQPGYELETIEEHAAFMWANSYLPAVGPTVENGAAWNLTEMTGGMLNELEKAHIYIEQLNDDLVDSDVEIRDLEQRLVRLEALLTSE